MSVSYCSAAGMRVDSEQTAASNSGREGCKNDSEQHSATVASRIDLAQCSSATGVYMICWELCSSARLTVWASGKTMILVCNCGRIRQSWGVAMSASGLEIVARYNSVMTAASGSTLPPDCVMGWMDELDWVCRMSGPVF